MPSSAAAPCRHTDWKLVTAHPLLACLQGPAIGLRSKVQAGPLLHSAAARYSHGSGWQLSAKR